jgi:hypothetical protein
VCVCVRVFEKCAPGALEQISIFLHKIAVGLAKTTHIYTPYMTVYLVISLPEIPCVHRKYIALANPANDHTCIQTYNHSQ